MIIFETTICFMIASMDFLKNHSTGFAAMELMDKVLENIDDKHITLAICKNIDDKHITLSIFVWT